MIIMKLSDGLGNQMYQYAYGRNLSLLKGQPLLLELSYFGTPDSPAYRRFMLPLFPKLSQPSDIWRPFVPVWDGLLENTDYEDMRRQYHWLFRHDPPVIPITKAINIYADESNLERTTPVCLEGYWQNQNYFKNSIKQIADDFTFPELAGAAKDIAARISDCQDSVSVHIRRGDYAVSSFGVLSTGFYSRALEFIKRRVENPLLVLISDDPAWVKSTFDCQGLASVVCESCNVGDELNDMQLISLCRHHVVANSSYSWWGAWLGNVRAASTPGYTIGPRFYLRCYPEWSPFPSEWIRL